jgi:hypothetical protein
MNDTPTPETDRASSVGLVNADRECVPADFARQLERELTKLKQSIANLSHPNCQMLLREIANAADMRYRANEALADINQLEP